MSLNFLEGNSPLITRYTLLYKMVRHFTTRAFSDNYNPQRRQRAGMGHGSAVQPLFSRWEALGLTTSTENKIYDSIASKNKQCKYSLVGDWQINL